MYHHTIGYIKNTIVAKLQREDKSEEDIEMQIHTKFWQNYVASVRTKSPKL